jgi:hypothetical protein
MWEIREMPTECVPENLKGRDYLKDLDRDWGGGTILKWI